MKNRITEEQRDFLRENIKFLIPESISRAPQDVLDELHGMTEDEIKAWAGGMSWFADKVIQAIDSATVFRYFDTHKTSQKSDS